MIIILINIASLVSCASYSPTVEDRRNPGSNGGLHTVASGETLASISRLYKLNYKDLARLNNIQPPYIIHPGQQLRLGPVASFRGNNAGKTANIAANNNRSKNRTKKSNMAPQKTYLGGTVRWQWPVKGKIVAQFQGETGLNKGIDLGGNLGEPVLAAASGQVIYAGSGLSGYGNLLIIKHSEIFLSAYAHNNQLLVKEGDIVKAGQKIADMGSSGTDRVKLHFEIRSEGNPVDPLKFLPKR